MTPRQITVVNSSGPTRRQHASTISTSENTELAQFIEAVCGHGDCLRLRPQQRVPLPPPGKVIVLREGMLAIDAMPAKGKLQVLDFLVAGDVVSTSAVLPTPGVSFRALTSASLVSLDPPAIDRTVPAHDYWTFLVAQCLNQLTRGNIHQLMIGRLESEPRVASFLLGLALRAIRAGTPEVSVALPMSRTDIANYLVMNRDTLSRTMMRFCDDGLIERESRHAIRVIDIDALRKKSPLASLLSAVFERGLYRQEISFGRYAERSAAVAAVQPGHGIIPPAVTANILSGSSASRVGW